jgi:polysaccharide lyase-like protein
MSAADDIRAGLTDVWSSDFVQANPKKAYAGYYPAEYDAVAAYLAGGPAPNLTGFSKLGRGLCAIEAARRSLEPPPPDPEPTTPPRWNGDWETGDLTQYGGVERKMTVNPDGSKTWVPINQRVFVTQGVDGVTPLQGNWFAKVLVKPGDKYGGSSGERVLIRQYEPIAMRSEGYECWLVWGVLFPTSWQDAWVVAQWHQNGGSGSKPLDVDPNQNEVIFHVGYGNDWGRRSYPVLTGELTKMRWHVFVQHHLLSLGSAGRFDLWHGEKGRHAAVRRLVTDTGPNLKDAPMNLAHWMIGLYDGAKAYDRVVYHDAAREYGDEASALAYANALLG